MVAQRMNGAVDLRERILDAAEECLIESPQSTRLHAAIARRASVSRPTVYKYVGDQDDILRALVEREAARFVGAVTPLLLRRLPPREHYLELVVFAVSRYQQHELFQAMLLGAPGSIARNLTTEFGTTFERGVAAAAAVMRAAFGDSLPGSIKLEIPIEWGVRMAISLLITPTPTCDTSNPESVRAYVDALFAFVCTPAPA